jgi:4-amino-4-deoxy-L-arabinose transferase-like glycosyltransferase
MTQRAVADSQRRAHRERWLLLLLAVALLPFFVGLGDSSIWDANEAFYVETPREMIERGDYVFPTFNYQPRLNKPVLSYWIVAGLYKAFGVSVGVQRFGIALGGMLIIAAAFGLGWLAAGGTPSHSSAPLRTPLHPGPPHPSAPLRTPRHPSAPWYAASIAAIGLAVDPRLVMFARRIFIDVWISAFMVLILLWFALSERFPERRRRFLVLMYVSVGLGVLTKGPIAAALPGLVFAVYLLVHRELRRAREMMIPTGVLIVIAIVAPWYVALYLRDGWTHITAFFIGENFGRYASGIGQQTARAWYFYLPVVFGDGFPLSLFLIPAAIVCWRTRERLQTLLWLWIVVIVVFFSFSHDKQDLYIFPIVPAVAALGAVAIVRQEYAPKAVWVASVGLGLLLAGLGAGVLYLFETGGRVYALAGVRGVGLIAVAGGVAAAVLALQRRVTAAPLVVFIALAAVNWMFVLRVLPDFERYKPVPPLSDYLRPVLQPGDRLAHFNVALPSMVYYLRHHVEPYYSPESFVDAMRSNARVYGILSDRDYAGMVDDLAATTCVLHRVPTFDVKLKNVLARDPLPQLLLITNRCEGR